MTEENRFKERTPLVRHGNVTTPELRARLLSLGQEAQDAEAADHAAARVVPEPEVRAVGVGVHDGRVSRGAATIHNLAVKHGWTVQMTYARGPLMHSTYQTFLRVADSVLVKGARRREVYDPLRRTVDERFSAVWLDGAFEFAYGGVVGADAKRLNSKDLKASISA